MTTRALPGSTTDFLWSTWTRFEPAGDVYAAETRVVRHHLSYRGAIVIDARKKPSLPDELVVRDDIAATVDRRLARIFSQRAILGKCLDTRLIVSSARVVV